MQNRARGLTGSINGELMRSCGTAALGCVRAQLEVLLAAEAANTAEAALPHISGAESRTDSPNPPPRAAQALHYHTDSAPARCGGRLDAVSTQNGVPAVTERRTRTRRWNMTRNINRKLSSTTVAALASAALAVGVIGCSAEEPQRPVMYGTSGNRTGLVPPVDNARGSGDHTPDQNATNSFPNRPMNGGANNGAAVGAGATIGPAGAANTGAAGGAAGVTATGSAAAPNTTVTNGVNST